MHVIPDRGGGGGGGGGETVYMNGKEGLESWGLAPPPPPPESPLPIIQRAERADSLGMAGGLG